MDKEQLDRQSGWGRQASDPRLEKLNDDAPWSRKSDKPQPEKSPDWLLIETIVSNVLSRYPRQSSEKFMDKEQLDRQSGWERQASDPRLEKLNDDAPWGRKLEPDWSLIKSALTNAFWYKYPIKSAGHFYAHEEGAETDESSGKFYAYEEGAETDEFHSDRDSSSC